MDEFWKTISHKQLCDVGHSGADLELVTIRLATEKVTTIIKQPNNVNPNELLSKLASIENVGEQHLPNATVAKSMTHLRVLVNPHLATCEAITDAAAVARKDEPIVGTLNGFPKGRNIIELAEACLRQRWDLQRDLSNAA